MNRHAREHGPGMMVNTLGDLAMSRHLAMAGLVVSLVLTACGGSTPAGAPPSGSPPPSVAPPSTAPPAAATAAAPAEPFGRVGTAVLGDGRRVSVSCFGTRTPGQPTVLFEHGLGGGASAWAGVQMALADTVRSCAYDRAGVGRSDPAAGAPRTADDLVDDLEAMLAAIQEPGPYLVVSHSLGAWVATLFTARHPEDVAGLVYVDPRPHQATDRHIAALPSPAADEDSVVTEVRSFLADPVNGLDVNAERVTYAASEAQVGVVLDGAGPAFHDRPLIVLHAQATIDEFPALPSSLREMWWEIWIEGQESLAAESSEGSIRSVASGHDVPREAPNAVVQAVLELLDAGL